MAGCGCGGGAAKAKQMAVQLAETFGSDMTTDTGMVVLTYIGPGSGTQTYGGKGRTASGKEYRAGNNAAKRHILVEPGDDVYLLSLRLFVRDAAPAPFVPPPLEDGPVATEPPPKKATKREKALA